MDADEAGAGFGERLDVMLRLVEHQVHVEEELGGPAERRDRARAEGEVRHEMPVHDVEVDPRQAQAFDQRRAVGEAGVIPGEDGRDEKRRVHEKKAGGRRLMVDER